MSKNKSNTENLNTVYGAIVDYHNNLVHMRFTVAGLYLAATGFLVGALFGSNTWIWMKLSITVLGISMSAVAWLLEIRTYNLLENLAKRGLKIEMKLKLSNKKGFFSLMGNQPIPPRLPIFRFRLGKSKVVRYIISHSLGLDLLYTFVTVFWILMLIFYHS